MIIDRLFEMQDMAYRDFQARLMPNIEKERIIGVRVPKIRALAKELRGTDEAVEFLKVLPHDYYEENNLHAFLIECIKDFDTVIAELDRFLPYVDNWATCDSMSPKMFRKHLDELTPHIRRWLESDRVYTVRFGMGMLMNFYLDDAFKPEQLDWVLAAPGDDYYIKMMRAWYFATALAKQYDVTLPVIEQKRMEPWTHNKTIQKAIESYRITDEQKAYLRQLKVESGKWKVESGELRVES